MLFMKGTRNFPQCGFSNTAVQILLATEVLFLRCINSSSNAFHYQVDFEVFDVFSDESIRQGIKTFSNWPTIPQLYIHGEFIGGKSMRLTLATLEY